jgi:ADP-ribose pyrophosphatase YjhB (NUDIX family)
VKDVSGYTYIKSKYGYMGKGHLDTVVNLPVLGRNEWLLAPIYRRTDVLETDFQPGIVTGTCHIGESYENAAIREVKEELKLYILERNMHKVSIIYEKTRTWFVYHVDLSDVSVSSAPTNYSLSHPDPVVPESEPEDDRSRKVVIMLHGTCNQAKLLVEKTANIKRDETDISGTKAVPIKMLQTIYKRHHKALGFKKPLLTMIIQVY